ncbi:MAG: hypothetical protein KDB14_07695 [Planctomycetales bacterium]|nr:hypothetical protein [Planctomycetales bacterium]
MKVSWLGSNGERPRAGASPVRKATARRSEIEGGERRWGAAGVVPVDDCTSTLDWGSGGGDAIAAATNPLGIDERNQDRTRRSGTTRGRFRPR